MKWLTLLVLIAIIWLFVSGTVGVNWVTILAGLWATLSVPALLTAVYRVYWLRQGAGWSTSLHAPNASSAAQTEAQLQDMSPAMFQQIYLQMPGPDYGPEAEELVRLLVHAGIGVGMYDPLASRPPIFWRKAAKAANELDMWLKENPTASPEARAAHARKVVDINRLVHRSLLIG